MPSYCHQHPPHPVALQPHWCPPWSPYLQGSCSPAHQTSAVELAQYWLTCLSPDTLSHSQAYSMCRHLTILMHQLSVHTEILSEPTELQLRLLLVQVRQLLVALYGPGLCKYQCTHDAADMSHPRRSWGRTRPRPPSSPQSRCQWHTRGGGASPWCRRDTGDPKMVQLKVIDRIIL